MTPLSAPRSVSPRDPSHRHAIVLAGGEGRRLAGLTRELYGYARPKQFCALEGPRTLLDAALDRALRFAGSEDRVVVSTVRAHRPEALEALAGRAVHRAEQPRDLGTLPGLVLSLLHVMVRDPRATVLVLPADHVTSDDELLVARLLDAAPVADDPIVRIAAAVRPGTLGDLGGVVPALDLGRVCGVEGWVEPGATRAPRGTLANTGLLLARASALAERIRWFAPAWWSELTGAFGEWDAVHDVYRRSPASDLYRDVVARTVDDLAVVPLHGVEWDDLDEPDHVASRGRTDRWAFSTPPGIDRQVAAP